MESESVSLLHSFTAKTAKKRLVSYFDAGLFSVYKNRRIST